jgi:hypothetical protein
MYQKVHPVQLIILHSLPLSPFNGKSHKVATVSGRNPAKTFPADHIGNTQFFG